MSLINKMLRDIESRQGQAPAPARSAPARPVYQDLRPTAVPPVTPRPPRLLLVIGGAIVVVAGGYFIWERGLGRLAAPASQSAPSAVATAKRVEPAPPGVAASAPKAPPPLAVAVPTPKPEPAGATPPGNEMPTAAPADPVAVPAASHAPSTTPAAPKPDAARAPVPPRSIESTVASGAIDKRVRPMTPEERAEDAYRQALRALQRGREGDATRLSAQALTAHAPHVHARELLVALALKNGRAREAQQLLDEGTRLLPQHYPFAQLLARLYVDRGDEARALALLEQAAAPASADPEYQALLAALYQRLGRHADAVAAYRRSLDLQPYDGRAWVGLGISLEAEKDVRQARQAYRQAQETGNLPPALARYANQRLEHLNPTE